MAFSTTGYRMSFKVLEIGASAVFGFLRAKALCFHFYNDLKRLVQKRQRTNRSLRRSHRKEFRPFCHVYEVSRQSSNIVSFDGRVVLLVGDYYCRSCAAL
jgi:hypothetical protein